MGKQEELFSSPTPKGLGEWKLTWLMWLSGPLLQFWPPPSCRDMWWSSPAYSRSLLTLWAIHFLIPSSKRSSASCICCTAPWPWGLHSSEEKPILVS